MTPKEKQLLKEIIELKMIILQMQYAQLMQEEETPHGTTTNADN
jgi:hypothetical protein